RARSTPSLSTLASVGSDIQMRPLDVTSLSKPSTNFAIRRMRWEALDPVRTRFLGTTSSDTTLADSSTPGLSRSEDFERSCFRPWAVSAATVGSFSGWANTAEVADTMNNAVPIAPRQLHRSDSSVFEANALLKS